MELLSTAVSSFKSEIVEEQFKLKRVTDLINVYENIVEGNYIDKIIRGQKEQEQSKTPDALALSKS